MPVALPASKRSRVISMYLAAPYTSKQQIADYCNVSQATAFRIIRSYKVRTRYRKFKHCNSQEARDYRKANNILPGCKYEAQPRTTHPKAVS